MSSYAILGATGNCGSALVNNLLKSPNNKVHAYCRNKAKLIRMMPHAVENKRMEIFEGSVTDVELMKNCLRGCQAVFMVATTNTNLPGCRVSQDSAEAIIAALQSIKAEGETPSPMPKIVLLSSATLDPYLNRNMPWWFLPIMLRAGSFVYDDLIATEKFLREQQDWVTTIFIKPGGLANDRSRGHKLDFDFEDSFIAYPDLAAAMIEAVEDGEGKYDMRNVSVVNTGGSAAFPKATPLCILVGLLRHYVPWTHPYLPSVGP
jgi:putative NADH-flavin reductase